MDSYPLVVHLPWPFLVDAIESSLKKKKKKKLLHLVLKKNLNDPRQKEFGGRSKWDVDLLKPWKNLPGNGSLVAHIEAQFDCNYLAIEKSFLQQSDPVMPLLYNLGQHLNPPLTSPMLKLREIVRGFFYGYSRQQPFNLFAVYDRKQTDPVFQLRVRPPVRFTPQGAPLLLVSVIDHQLAQQLISQGKLDPEQCQSDLHRIITEGVSREVCTIHTSSAEEVQLLRFSLRLNSTKMRRGAWQSKKIPRGDDSPWMSTYVTPLYAEKISNLCGH